MRELSIRQRVEVFVEHGDMLITKTNSRPETAPTVSDFLPAHEALFAKRDAWLVKRDALTRARLELAEAGENQDQAVRAAAHAIRDRNGNSRTSNLWLLNFPRGFTEIIQAPTQEERTQILVLAERLAAVDDPEIQARAEQLRAAADRAGRAFDAVQTALAEERTAFGLLQAEKVKWSNARRRLFNAIQGIYADDRRKAEYFFDHAPISHKRNGKPPVEPPKPQQQSVERVVVGAISAIGAVSAVEAAGAAGAVEVAGAVGVASSAA